MMLFFMFRQKSFCLLIFFVLIQFSILHAQKIEFQQHLKGHTKGMGLRGISWSKDGKWIASCNLEIIIWETVNFTEHKKIQTNGILVNDVCFSPDSKTLMSTTFDGKINFYDTESGRLIKNIQAFDFESVSLAISPDGKYIACSGNGLEGDYLKSGLKIFETESGKLVRLLDSFTSRECRIAQIKFSPDGQYLATANGSSDASLTIYETLTGGIYRKFINIADIVSIAFSPNGKTIASGSTDNKIRLYDLSTGSSTRIIEGLPGDINDLVFSPDGQYLYSLSASNTGDGLKIWEIKSGVEEGRYTTQLQKDYYFALSPDGKKLAISGAKNMVEIVGLPIK